MEKKEEIVIATKEHCVFSFDVLLNVLGFTLKEEKLICPKDIDGVDAKIFVTFLKNDVRRGCIGNYPKTHLIT